jgi:hypothetical protein
MTKLEREYQQYLADFDPTPQYYGDDYGTPMDFDTYCLMQEQPEETNDDCYMSYSNLEVI